MGSEMCIRDRSISVRLASAFAEVGGAFHVSISRAPQDGTTNREGAGRVRHLRVSLGYETDGRGDTDSDNFQSLRIPIDQFGMGSADNEIPVPIDAPISYRGELMSLAYWITVTTDVEMSLDHIDHIPVVVVPKNGMGTYTLAHPLQL